MTAYARFIDRQRRANNNANFLIKKFNILPSYDSHEHENTVDRRQ